MKEYACAYSDHSQVVKAVFPRYFALNGTPTHSDEISMVLRLHNTFRGRSRYSLASALIYQVARRPQSGFDRWFHATFNNCRADSN